MVGIPKRGAYSTLLRRRFDCRAVDLMEIFQGTHRSAAGSEGIDPQALFQHDDYLCQVERIQPNVAHEGIAWGQRLGPSAGTRQHFLYRLLDRGVEIFRRSHQANSGRLSTEETRRAIRRDSNFAANVILARLSPDEKFGAVDIATGRDTTDRNTAARSALRLGLLTVHGVAIFCMPIRRVPLTRAVALMRAVLFV